MRNIRFLRPDVAIVFSKAQVKLQEGGEMETRPTMVVVKEQGKWQIVAFQNTKLLEVPAAASGLAALRTDN